MITLDASVWVGFLDRNDPFCVRIEPVQRFADDPLLGKKPIAQQDVAGLLKLMWET